MHSTLCLVCVSVCLVQGVCDFIMTKQAGPVNWNFDGAYGATGLSAPPRRRRLSHASSHSSHRSLSHLVSERALRWDLFYFSRPRILLYVHF